MKTKTLNAHIVTLTLLWSICTSTTSVLAEDAPKDGSQTSAPSTNTVKPNRVEPNKQTSLLADLSKELEDSETDILSLKAGEDNFDTYYRNTSGAISHGGIVFFPDDFTHPNWPIFIEPLRTGLSEFGWSTLAIPLPPPITPANPSRTLPSLKAINSQPSSDIEDLTPPAPTSSLEQTTATATTPTTPPLTNQESEPLSSEAYQQIIQRGITAVQALQQKGVDRFILAGAGSGATWATALALNLQAQLNINLLIINAEQSSDISAPKLLDLIPELKITTLDIHSSPPKSAFNTHSSSAELRIKTARRNNVNNYHQSRLPATSSTPQGQEWLIRYTRGLLETYIIKAEKDAIVIPSAPAPSINQQPGTPSPLQKKPTDPI